MGYDFNPSLWFVCRLCSGSFATTETLKEHKLACHLGECLEIKCIVFEERLLNEEWMPDQNLCRDQNRLQNGNYKNPRSSKECGSKGQLDFGFETGSLFKNPFVSLARLTEREINSSLNTTNQLGNKPRRRTLRRRKKLLQRSSSSKSKADGNEPEVSKQVLRRAHNHKHINTGSTNTTVFKDIRDPHNFSKTQESIQFKTESSIYDESTPGNSLTNEEAFNIFEGVNDPEFIVGIVSPNSDEVPTMQFPHILSPENQEYQVISYANSSDTAVEHSRSVHQEILPDSAAIDFNPILTGFQIKMDTFDSDLLLVETSDRETVQNQEGEPEAGGSTASDLPPSIKTTSANEKAIIKPFMCETCFASLSSKGALKRHMTCHSSYKPFKCSKCPLSFKRKDVFLSHQVVHGEETNLKCRFCNKCFGKKYHLVDHERSHTGYKPFKCPIRTCAYAATSQNVLAKHTRARHCDELGLQQFLCPFCGKGYGIRSSLELHIRAHHMDITPFHCTQPGCTMKFKLKSQLRVHLKKHLSA